MRNPIKVQYARQTFTDIEVTIPDACPKCSADLHAKGAFVKEYARTETVRASFDGEWIYRDEGAEDDSGDAICTGFACVGCGLDF